MVIFSQGSYRYVFAIPAWGIVIKVPRIHWGTIGYHLREMTLHVLRGEWWKIKKRIQIYRELSVRHHFTLKAAIGKGVVDNWCERQFYKYANPLHQILLQPTYFSLLGLLNIQKYGRPLDRPKDYERFKEWWTKWYRIVGQDLIIDGHHFEDSHNFHSSSGQVKFLDYGGDRTQEILANYGMKILQEFKL